MESYIGSILKRITIKNYFRKEIISIYKQNEVQSKTVDFIVREDVGTVYIDSKAIEPD